jgi:hypothetical protein
MSALDNAAHPDGFVLRHGGDEVKPHYGSSNPDEHNMDGRTDGSRRQRHLFIYSVVVVADLRRCNGVGPRPSLLRCCRGGRPAHRCTGGRRRVRRRPRPPSAQWHRRPTRRPPLPEGSWTRTWPKRPQRRRAAESRGCSSDRIGRPPANSNAAPTHRCRGSASRARVQCATVSLGSFLLI